MKNYAACMFTVIIVLLTEFAIHILSIIQKSDQNVISRNHSKNPANRKQQLSALFTGFFISLPEDSGS
jgi:hypothetical protein